MRILTRIERIGDVERLHVARATPTGGAWYWTSTYLTGGILVDSGNAHARAAVASYLDERDVVAAIATHEHEDHVGNHALLAERGIPSLAPARAVDLLARFARGKRGRLPYYRRLVWGAHEGAAGVQPVGERVRAADKSFRVVPVPGHSPGHVAYLDEDTGALFTGDAVLGKLRLIRKGEDAPAQVDSLRAIRDLDARVIFPAHGRVITRPSEDLDAIIAHFEGLSRKAHALAARGRSMRAITREVLGAEPPMSWLSGFEFSKRRLVESLLTRAVA